MRASRRLYENPIRYRCCGCSETVAMSRAEGLTFSPSNSAILTSHPMAGGVNPGRYHTLYSQKSKRRCRGASEIGVAFRRGWLYLRSEADWLRGSDGA